MKMEKIERSAVVSSRPSIAHGGQEAYSMKASEYFAGCPAGLKAAELARKARGLEFSRLDAVKVERARWRFPRESVEATAASNFVMGQPKRLGRNSLTLSKATSKSYGCHGVQQHLTL